MAIRIRRIGGKVVALCAAKYDPEPGDHYIDDAEDHAIRAKIECDFDREGCGPSKVAELKAERDGYVTALAQANLEAHALRVQRANITIDRNRLADALRRAVNQYQKTYSRPVDEQPTASIFLGQLMTDLCAAIVSSDGGNDE